MSRGTVGSHGTCWRKIASITLAATTAFAFTVPSGAVAATAAAGNMAPPFKTASSDTPASSNTIAYELNGGKWVEGDIYGGDPTDYAGELPSNLTTYTTGTALNLPTSATSTIYPSRDGYTFDGWYSDKDLTNKVEAVPADASGALTYYAKWTALPASYKVSFADFANAHGKVTLYQYNQTDAPKAGDQVYLTVTPDDGYELDTLTVTTSDGSAVAVQEAFGMKYFVMPASDVTVSATFKAKAAQTKNVVTLTNVTGNYSSGGTEFNLKTGESKTVYVDPDVTKADGSDVTQADILDLTVKWYVDGATEPVATQNAEWNAYKNYPKGGIKGGACKYAYQPDANTTDGDHTVTAKATWTLNGPTVESEPVTFTFHVTKVATYAVALDSSAQGKVTVDPEQAAEGQQVTVTKTSGSDIQSITVTKADGTGTIAATANIFNTNWTFTMPACGVTISDPDAQQAVTKIDVPQAVTGLVCDTDGETTYGQVGVKGGDGYTLSYEKESDWGDYAIVDGDAKAAPAGTYEVTATLKDGYAWSDGTTDSKKISFAIAAADLSNATVEGIEASYVYDDTDVYGGSDVDPVPSAVKLGTRTLDSTWGYQVSYEDSTGGTLSHVNSAGTYYVVIKPNNGDTNITGEKKVSFEVVNESSQQKTYSISYELNGGKWVTDDGWGGVADASGPAESDASYTAGTAKDLPTNVNGNTYPSRQYYTFSGWYSDKALTEKAESVPADATGDKTYYAKWAEATRYLTLTGDDLDGATVTVTDHNGNVVEKSAYSSGTTLYYTIPQAGTTEVKVTKDGYEDASYEIAEGEDGAFQTVELTEKQASKGNLEAFREALNAIDPSAEVNDTFKENVSAAGEAYNKLSDEEKKQVTSSEEKLLKLANKAIELQIAKDKADAATTAAEQAAADANTAKETAEKAKDNAEAAQKTAEDAQKKAETDLAAAQAQLAQAKSDLETAKTAAAEAEKKATDAQASLDAANSKVDDLQKQLDEAKKSGNEEKVKALEERLAVAQKAASDAQAAQAAAQKTASDAQASLATAQGTIASLQRQLASAEGNANALAAAKAAQAKAEQEAKDAKAAQAKAQQDALAAQTAQANAEEALKEAKDAQAKAEQTAKEAQDKADQAAKDLQAAQGKSADELAAAKTAQAAAEQEAKDAKAAQAKAEQAVKDAQDKLASAQQKLKAAQDKLASAVQDARDAKAKAKKYSTRLIRASFTPNLSVKNVKGKKVKVTWNDPKYVKGLKYQVSWRVKGTSKWKTKLVGKKKSASIAKLKKGKTYQVRVRGYKKANGKKVYTSGRSNSVKIRK